jgi:PKD repeat protein
MGHATRRARLNASLTVVFVLLLSAGWSCAATPKSLVLPIQPESNIAAMVTTGCGAPTVQFSSIAELDPLWFHYLWDFGDGGTSIEEDPLYTYDVANTYHVTLTIYEMHGLQAVASVDVIVAYGPPCADPPPVTTTTTAAPVTTTTTAANGTTTTTTSTTTTTTTTTPTTTTTSTTTTTVTPTTTTTTTTPPVTTTTTTTTAAPTTTSTTAAPTTTSTTAKPATTTTRAITTTTTRIVKPPRCIKYDHQNGMEDNEHGRIETDGLGHQNVVLKPSRRHKSELIVREGAKVKATDGDPNEIYGDPALPAYTHPVEGQHYEADDHQDVKHYTVCFDD